jgi:hypothetical protein
MGRSYKKTIPPARTIAAMGRSYKKTIPPVQTIAAMGRCYKKTIPPARTVAAMGRSYKKTIPRAQNGRGMFAGRCLARNPPSRRHSAPEFARKRKRGPPQALEVRDASN